ncbi:MAG: nucleotidyltransferase domain-containing protein, partial [Nanoarchaeota archaeon]
YKQIEQLKEIPPEVKKEIDKLRANLQKFTNELLKKMPFILSVGVLPVLPPLPGTEHAKKPEKKKPELVIVIPDEKLKEVNKIEKEVAEIVKKQGLEVIFIVRATSELWQLCFDGHYPDIERIGMAVPLSDKGLLGALRVAVIHKNLVIRKFEKYVVSYVIAGSLVRGQATKTSDVDIYVIIDDTDVKRMSRFELKERLRSMILAYAFEANEFAAAKNKLSPQIYILTDFWESVKDANPVIFTFIRDGVPLYDRGTFMPWKLLLKMGKIKPSPEAIDMFLLLGEKMEKRVKEKLSFIATEDIYWGVITPSQAALMLYGLPPPTPLETIEVMEKTFVEKEKLLEKKYVNILEKIVKLYKEFEHGKLKEVSGKEIDGLLEDANDYIKRLKKLVQEIEKRASEKTIVQLYDESFELLKNIFGKLSEEQIIGKFKEDVIDKGHLPERALVILREIKKAKSDFKKGKLTKHEIDRIRKDTREFISYLVDYAQRKDAMQIEKLKFRVRVGDEEGELYLLDDEAFIIPNTARREKEVTRIDLKTKKAEESNLEELYKKVKEAKNVEIDLGKMSDIKKIYNKKITLLL